MESAAALPDGKIVDTGDAQAHQAMLVELPILVAVAPKPMTAVVVPAVSKACGDAVIAEGPDFLDQAVIKLPAPLARQEGLDGLTALPEFRPVPPAAVGILRQPRALTHQFGVKRVTQLRRLNVLAFALKPAWAIPHRSGCCRAKIMYQPRTVGGKVMNLPTWSGHAGT